MCKKKKSPWTFVYGLALTLFTAYVLLDAFVIPRSYSQAVDSTSDITQEDPVTAQAADPSAESGASVTATSYDSSGISITISSYRENDTDIYVADILLTSADSLKTALAQNTYGKNITQTTSAIAQANNAILAINGDYYGTRSGYVIRDGVLYRSSSAGDDQQDLVIYSDGSFEIISEGDYTAQELLNGGAEQLLSFGPGLLADGQVLVSQNSEVDRARASNPGTAIGMIEPLHYVFVVADGRSTQSEGLSLYQLAGFMQSLGVQCAYNLDGGGSSTMVFNGSVINIPVSGGKSSSERKVSDIVYIG